MVLIIFCQGLFHLFIFDHGKGFIQGVIHDFQQRGYLFGLDYQRRREGDDIADGAGDYASAFGHPRHMRADAEVRREGLVGAFIAYQFQSADQADAARFATTISR